MYTLILYLILFLFMCFIKSSFQNQMLYGEYKVIARNVTSCPEFGNMTELMNVTWNRLASGADEIIISGQLEKSLGPIGIELLLHSWINDHYVTIMTIKTKNICQLDTTRGKSANVFPKLDHRCFLQKGNYFQKVDSIDSATHDILGFKLPYGKFKSRALVTCGKRMLVCRYTFSEIIPK